MQCCIKNRHVQWCWHSSHVTNMMQVHHQTITHTKRYLTIILHPFTPLLGEIARHYSAPFTVRGPSAQVCRLPVSNDEVSPSDNYYASFHVSVCVCCAEVRVDVSDKDSSASSCRAPREPEFDLDIPIMSKGFSVRKSSCCVRQPEHLLRDASFVCSFHKDAPTTSSGDGRTNCAKTMFAAEGRASRLCGSARR
jgi:hypothetical protein